MQRLVIHTVAELIEAFGGPARVAEWGGTSSQNICNWAAKEKVPPGWHLRLLIEARERNWVFSPGLFGLTERQMEKLRKTPLETVLMAIAV